MELTRKEEKEILKITQLNKQLSYQQAKRLVLEKAKQKRL